MGCARDVTKGCLGDDGSVFVREGVRDKEKKSKKERNSHSDLSTSGKDFNRKKILGPLSWIEPC